MSTSNSKLAQLASRNRSFERQPEKLIEIYETMTALVKAHLEREAPAGGRILARSGIFSLIVGLLFLVLVGIAIYFTFTALALSVSGWITLLVTCAGTAIVMHFIEPYMLRFHANSYRAAESNIEDVSARLTTDICQTFPDRKVGHIATDFLQLWGVKAFYDAAPWFKFFHPSNYSYLVVSRVYDQLSVRSSEQLRQRDRSSHRLQPQPSEVASTPAPTIGVPDAPPLTPQVTPRTERPAFPEITPSSLGSYTRSTLQRNETALYKTSIHWIAFARAGIFALVALLLFALPIGVGIQAVAGSLWGWLALLLPLVIILPAIIAYISSELVITNRRVLVKVGFIRRRTLEMFISKIESVGVDQTIFGRLFNYGTVTICGTGGSAERLKTIANPIEFRNVIQNVQGHTE